MNKFHEVVNLTPYQRFFELKSIFDVKSKQTFDYSFTKEVYEMTIYTDYIHLNDRPNGNILSDVLCDMNPRNFMKFLYSDIFNSKFRKTIDEETVRTIVRSFDSYMFGSFPQFPTSAIPKSVLLYTAKILLHIHTLTPSEDFISIVYYMYVNTITLESFNDFYEELSYALNNDKPLNTLTDETTFIFNFLKNKMNKNIKNYSSMLKPEILIESLFII